MELTSENFLLYAAKHYDNPYCTSISDFQDDLQRFKYIKRLIKKYQKNGNINERLLINHFVLLHNVFGSHLVPMLFCKFSKEYWSALKTVLVFLDYIEPHYKIFGTYDEVDVPLDRKIINILRKI